VFYTMHIFLRVKSYAHRVDDGCLTPESEVSREAVHLRDGGACEHAQLSERQERVGGAHQRKQLTRARTEKPRERKV